MFLHRTCIRYFCQCSYPTSSTHSSSYEHLIVTTCGAKKNIGLIQFNRPKVLNAFNSVTLNELNTAVKAFDTDDSIRAVVLTGSLRSFCSGADTKGIPRMHGLNLAKILRGDLLSGFTTISETRKPIVAAVNGFAIGGGFELAMMCDIIYAGHLAHFQQPEIQFGTIPRGTQWLPRFAGKSLAMETLLTGGRLTAEEARTAGLVSRVLPAEELVVETLNLADRIAEQSPGVLRSAKEAVNAAFETTLHEGIAIERVLFHSTFATEDQKEGMQAFVEKRTPNWRGA